ncbi:single-stranded DNA-binding protein [Armatimonas sp.]|uniref:single-stranded DNA-binding protein n=1 Tax=Armatimonas sp. TaxID=1872638 RepID=UPI00286AC580|nr:single-stranded DNA-binding protein [Armatimonas sp.]
MLNRVILIGRLVADPELKYTPSGIAVAQFRIAVDRPLSQEAKQQGQEKQADFIDIVAWRQSAEFASQYLTKGRLVAVEGRLQIREYQTQDGQKRKAAEIVADNLKGLDRARDGEGGEAGGYAGGYEQPAAAPAARGGGYERAAAPAAARPQAGYAGGGGGRARQVPENNYDDSDLSDPFAE